LIQELKMSKIADLVAVPIRAAPAAEAQSAAAVFAARTSIAALSEEDQTRLDSINTLLDEKIRLYLKKDGGDLHVVGLEGNQLSAHQGACGTCSSSISGTLRAIQNLVNSIEPDIEVVAV